MDICHHAGRIAAAAILLVVSGQTGSSAAEEKLTLPEGFPLWQPSASLRAGVGYKDNVTLSSFNPVGSGFESVNAEVMLFRLPWNNWQFTAFANGTDTRYFDTSTGVNTEQNAAASAQLGWFMGKDWKSTYGVDYVFINQVMDVSDTYAIPVREQVFGQGVTGKIGVRKDARPWYAELEFSVARYAFRSPLDDYWETGPKLAAGRYYGHSSEVALSYQFAPILYDTRPQAGPAGLPLEGTHLRFMPHTVELVWRHYWDQKNRWRNTTRLGLQVNHDNDSGYFDYTEYRLEETLRFRSASWELSLRGGVVYYDAPNQPVNLSELDGRCRTSLEAGLKVERMVAKHWKLYAAYDFEQSLSNLEAEQYHAHTGSAGVELSF